MAGIYVVKARTTSMYTSSCNANFKVLSNCILLILHPTNKLIPTGGVIIPMDRFITMITPS